MRSKIKIWTSSRHKAKLALWRDEIQILIFDYLADRQLEEWQRPEFCSAQLDCTYIENLNLKVGVSVLLLFAPLPDCSQNRTALSGTLRLLSDF
jgi:hypothetical protein